MRICVSSVLRQHFLWEPQVLPGMDVEVRHVKQAELPAFVFPDGAVLDMNSKGGVVKPL